MTDEPIDLEIAALQAAFYRGAERALGLPAWLEYERALGVDFPTLCANCGVFAVVPVRFSPDRTFYFDGTGIPSACVECLDADAETVIDLCAWPLHRPTAFATALGRAEALGLHQVSPATWACGGMLMVHRTPAGWLQAGCRGVVVLNPITAPAWLGSRALGPVVAEDVEHGRELARWLGRSFNRRDILAPVRPHRRRAA